MSITLKPKEYYLPEKEIENYKRQFTDKDYKVSEEIVKRVKEFFVEWGYAIQPKEKEDYKVDFTALKNNIPYPIEIEERKNIKFDSRKEFYPNVHFLARKKKFLNDGHFIYIIISSTGCMILRHSSDIFIEGFQKVVPCESTSHTGPDMVYVHPKSKCYFFNPNTDIRLPVNSRFTYNNKTYKVISLGIYKDENNKQSVEMCYDFYEENSMKRIITKEVGQINNLFDKGKIKLLI